MAGGPASLEIWVKIASDCHMTIDVEKVWKITNKEKSETLNVPGHYDVSHESNPSYVEPTGHLCLLNFKITAAPSFSPSRGPALLLLLLCLTKRKNFVV